MSHKAVGYVLLRSIYLRATSIQCRASELDYGPRFWASLDWSAVTQSDDATNNNDRMYFATFATYLKNTFSNGLWYYSVVGTDLVLVHLADIQRWPRNSHHVLHQTYRIPTQLPVDDVELDIDFVVSKDTNDAARPALVVIGLP